MAQASFALATEVLRELRSRGRRQPGATVLALVGGGNNGGDALFAAAFLARRGLAATAALLTDRAHTAGVAAAADAGVRLVPVVIYSPEHRSIGLDTNLLRRLADRSQVWLDGLAGIGVRGGLREPLAEAVRLLVSAREDGRTLVVAVDTPSGIGVEDGSLPGPVLPADLTVTMGVVKPGLILPPAAGMAGRVRIVDLGLADALAGRPAVERLTASDVAALWPVPAPAAQKYDRGVLGLVAGSARYPGAGVLASAGAVATGLGMVRYLGDDAVLHLLHLAHPEIVGAAGRVQAWALGSGVDTDDADVATGLADALRSALDDRLPAVLDAGALALLTPGHPAHVATRLNPAVVLTPHAGELADLLGGLHVHGDTGASVTRREVEACPARWARRAAQETGATVLLKGPVTVVAPPSGPLLAQADGTPWLATAGAGDVLTGVLGALLAGRADAVRKDPSLAARLAAAAALVHGRAAREASGSGPIAAGDVARRLPTVVREVLTASRGQSDRSTTP